MHKHLAALALIATAGLGSAQTWPIAEDVPKPKPVQRLPQIWRHLQLALAPAVQAVLEVVVVVNALTLSHSTENGTASRATLP